MKTAVYTHTLNGKPVIVLPKGKQMVAPDGTKYNGKQRAVFGKRRVKKGETTIKDMVQIVKAKVQENKPMPEDERIRKIGEDYILPIIKPILSTHRMVLIPYMDKCGKQKFHTQIVNGSKLKPIKEAS